MSEINIRNPHNPNQVFIPQDEILLLMRAKIDPDEVRNAVFAAHYNYRSRFGRNLKQHCDWEMPYDFANNLDGYVAYISQEMNVSNDLTARFSTLFTSMRALRARN